MVTRVPPEMGPWDGWIRVKKGVWKKRVRVNSTCTSPFYFLCKCKPSTGRQGWWIKNVTHNTGYEIWMLQWRKLENTLCSPDQGFTWNLSVLRLFSHLINSCPWTFERSQKTFLVLNKQTSLSLPQRWKAWVTGLCSRWHSLSHTPPPEPLVLCSRWHH